MKSKVYIFMALPGGGKGTQTELLIKHFQENEHKVFTFSVGDCLREMVKKNTLISNLTKHAMDSGLMLPSIYPFYVVMDSFYNNLKEEPEFMVFDGTSRKLVEAKLLIQLLKFFGIKEINIFFLDTDEETVKSRMLDRKRSDDTIGSIEKRFEEYYIEGGTKDSLEFYKGSKEINFIEINGNDTIENVYDSICKKL